VSCRVPFVGCRFLTTNQFDCTTSCSKPSSVVGQRLKTANWLDRTACRSHRVLLWVKEYTPTGLTTLPRVPHRVLLWVKDLTSTGLTTRLRVPHRVLLWGNALKTANWCDGPVLWVRAFKGLSAAQAAEAIPTLLRQQPTDLNTVQPDGKVRAPCQLSCVLPNVAAAKRPNMIEFRRIPRGVCDKHARH
jgi:hypothetical protein